MELVACRTSGSCDRVADPSFVEKIFVRVCVRHIENNLVSCFFITNDRPVCKNRKWYLFSMRV